LWDMAWSLSRFGIVGGFFGVIIEQPWIVLSEPLQIRVSKKAFAAQAIPAIRIDRLTA